MIAEKKKSYAEEILARSRQDSGLDVEEFGKDPYDLFCVPTEVYERHRDEILRLSLSFQRWVAPEDGGLLLDKVDQLSDAEIAERMGLDGDTVRRIRCMAEWDLPIEAWRNAAAFKRRRRLEHPLGCPDREIEDEPA